MTKQLTLSDAIFTTAEAVRTMGKVSGITIDIFDLAKNHAEELAMIAALLRQMVEKSSGHTIEVLNK